MEGGHAGGAPKMTLQMSLVPNPTTSSKPVKRLVMQMGDMDPMEMPLDMPQMPDQRFEKPDPKKLVGKETIKVAAGSFSTGHYRDKIEQGTIDLWINETIPPLGLVKMTVTPTAGSGGPPAGMVIELTGKGRGAKPAITKEAKPFDPAMFGMPGGGPGAPPRPASRPPRPRRPPRSERPARRDSSARERSIPRTRPRTMLPIMRRAMKRVVSYFVSGLIIVVPVALTLWLLRCAVRDHRRVDPGRPGHRDGGARAGPAGHLPLRHRWWACWARTFSPGASCRPSAGILERLPVVKMVYSAVKDMMNAFVGPERRFDRPVLVDLQPGGTLRALGFITRDSLAHLGLTEDVAVYFPQAYNFAGQVLIVRRTAVTAVEAPASQVMTFIVSGGVSGVPAVVVSWPMNRPEPDAPRHAGSPALWTYWSFGQ